MRFEKITLWTYIEGDDSFTEPRALDCVMSTLDEHLTDKCKILSFETEDCTGDRSDLVKPDEAFDEVRDATPMPSSFNTTQGESSSEPHWWL